MSSMRDSDHDEPITAKIITRLSQDSPFLKSIVATETRQNASAGILSFLSLKVQAITVEWIFGMGFDDHEESFVTLNNRNFSKLILD